MGFTESVVEEAALEWFRALGWEVRFGPDIAVDGSAPERADYRDVTLSGRLTEAVDRLNPGVPVVAREEALRRVEQTESPSLVLANRAFHEVLVNGVEVEVLVGRAAGS
jgi:type I restriction enzyme R subunit